MGLYICKHFRILHPLMPVQLVLKDPLKPLCLLIPLFTDSPNDIFIIVFILHPSGISFQFDFCLSLRRKFNKNIFQIKSTLSYLLHKHANRAPTNVFFVYPNQISRVLFILPSNNRARIAKVSFMCQILCICSINF